MSIGNQVVQMRIAVCITNEDTVEMASRANSIGIRYSSVVSSLNKLSGTLLLIFGSALTALLTYTMTMKKKS